MYERSPSIIFRGTSLLIKMVHNENYLNQMELNKYRKIETGLMYELFPEVSGIVIRMAYDSVVRIIKYWPSRHAYFNIDCVINDCNDGGCDLTSVITKMIQNGKKSQNGKLPFKGTIDAPTSDHARITYQITINYKIKK